MPLTPKLRFSRPFLNCDKISLASSIGGPIYIPKSTTGSTETFFLVNYEGWRIRNGINQGTPLTFPILLSLERFFGVTDGRRSPRCIPSATTFCYGPLTRLRALLSSPANIIPSSSFSRLAKVAIGGRAFPRAKLPCRRLSRKLSPDHSFAQHGRPADLQARPTTGPLWLDVLSLHKPRNTKTRTLTVRCSLPFGIGTFNEKSESWMISHTIPLSTIS